VAAFQVKHHFTRAAAREEPDYGSEKPVFGPETGAARAVRGGASPAGAVPTELRATLIRPHALDEDELSSDLRLDRGIEFIRLIPDPRPRKNVAELRATSIRAIRSLFPFDSASDRGVFRTRPTIGRRL